MKLTILIVCFNEEPTILKAVECARGINADKEIIVIDNCSTDGTKEILEGLKDDKMIKVVCHSKNMGVGYSVSEGINLAAGDYIHISGADLEYKMEDVYKMVDEMESKGLDAVFGSRLAGRKGTSAWHLVKERPYWLGTIIATFLINLLYRRSYTDVIATKLIKTDILKKLNYASNGQAFEFELVSKLCKRMHKIGELPVWYKPRTHKEGKTIRVFDMIPAILAILKVKFSAKNN